MYMELTEINGRHKIVYKSDKGKKGADKTQI